MLARIFYNFFVDVVLRVIFVQAPFRGFIAQIFNQFSPLVEDFYFSTDLAPDEQNERSSSPTSRAAKMVGICSCFGPPKVQRIAEEEGGGSKKTKAPRDEERNAPRSGTNDTAAQGRGVLDANELPDKASPTGPLTGIISDEV